MPQGEAQPETFLFEEFSQIPTSQRNSRQKKNQRVFGLLISLSLVCFVCLLAILLGPGIYARWSYEPLAGDIVFQSLNRSPLVNAIEGVTRSRFSHCGIVFEEDGKFFVCEALNGVEITPLNQFLKRGRQTGFAVYRFKEPARPEIPKIISNAKRFLGCPYDVRYRMDDESIYCSELIFKAYQQAVGEPLGELKELGEMNWQPYQQTIRHYERGPVPLDRKMITPVDLALAQELKLEYSFRIKTP